MRAYKIIPNSRHSYSSYGMVKLDGDCNIKLNIWKKSKKNKTRNEELFEKLVKLINKYYWLEDLSFMRKCHNPKVAMTRRSTHILKSKKK